MKRRRFIIHTYDTKSIGRFPTPFFKLTSPQTASDYIHPSASLLLIQLALRFSALERVK